MRAGIKARCYWAAETLAVEATKLGHLRRWGWLLAFDYDGPNPLNDT